MMRMQILVDPKHKKLAEKLARQSETTVSKIFARAIEAYDPDSAAVYHELDALTRALQDANRRARQALLEAEAEVEKTIADYGSNIRDGHLRVGA